MAQPLSALWIGSQLSDMGVMRVKGKGMGFPVSLSAKSD